MDKEKHVWEVWFDFQRLRFCVIRGIYGIFTLFIYFLVGLLAAQTTCLFVATFLPHSMIPLMISVAIYNCIFFLIVSLTSDAFPTSIRAFGVSTAGVCSQIAPGIANLFLPTLLISQCNAPFSIFGSFSVGKYKQLLSISLQHEEEYLIEKFFILPRVAELFIHKEKQRGCPLLGANRAPKTLSKELSSNNKDKLPNEEREGVYSLKCGDWKAVYVGKTERNLKIRMSEHLRDFKNQKTENSLAEHLNSNNHSFPEGIKYLKKKGIPN